MRNMKVLVQYWSYRDGWRDSYNTGVAEKTFDEDIKGWGCWVYTDDVAQFEDWLADNMQGSYECDYRFNSGNPMHTVLIRNDEDATAFKLKWV
jgi:hypothetical protein